MIPEGVSKLKNLAELEKYEQLQLLKEVLPELNNYQQELNSQLIAHLVRNYAPAGMKALRF